MGALIEYPSYLIVEVHAICGPPPCALLAADVSTNVEVQRCRSLIQRGGGEPGGILPGCKLYGHIGGVEVVHATLLVVE